MQQLKKKEKRKERQFETVENISDRKKNTIEIFNIFSSSIFSSSHLFYSLYCFDKSETNIRHFVCAFLVFIAN